MKGIIASSGIAIGKALLFQKNKPVIDCSLIENGYEQKEFDQFKKAVVKSEEQLRDLAEHTRKTLGDDNAAIFTAQLEVLNDPTLEECVFEKIRNQSFNVEYALDLSAKEICEIFANMDDPYLKERAADITDVCSRIMNNIKGIDIISLSNIKEECIVIAEDLTPSDTATIDLSKVLGFATDMGGSTSHTAIMAKSLEIPAIVGLKDISENVRSGDFVIIDALKGEIYINPLCEVINYYMAMKNEYSEHKKNLSELKDLSASTTDSRKVELCANIGCVSDLNGAARNGAEGIGLFRTEFLYMNNTHFPSEEEQFNAYMEAAKQMEGKAVIIRTLDIGGDKELPYFSFPKEQNPFLGWRAIRMCLERVDIFKVQLRAILRASAFGKVLVMFPMIISLDELRNAKKILDECKNELRCENITFDENIQVGIMVETPAVIVLADKFAKEVDFFSIGTNDLTQYTLAVDRGNEKISKLYNSMHPAVLNCIKRVIDASHKVNKWTGMCGELAGNEKAVPILLGMGLDEFSMSSVSIPEIKKLIRSMSYKQAQIIANKALDMNTGSEVEKYMESILSEIRRI